LDEILNEEYLESPSKLDSLELSNSDDINKIIQRYELDFSSQKKQKLTESMEEEIEIEKQLDQDYNFDSDDNIEEQIVTEVDQHPKQLKPVVSAEKFNSSAKNMKEWGDYDLDRFDEDDPIDEFIKKHLDEDTTTSKKKLDSDSSSSSSDNNEISQSGLSPKQALVQALMRLPDSDDAGEREQFIADIENILKILTIKETKQLVFPCLELVAADDSELLKIEFFKQLPAIVKKIMQSKVIVDGEYLDNEALVEVLTTYVFPIVA
jgi:hypothetical protein